MITLAPVVLFEASGRYVAAPDVVARVRSVIRSAKIRQQMLLDGREPAFMRDKPSEAPD